MMRSLALTLLGASALLSSTVQAQEGAALGGATSSTASAGYSCDSTTCVLPSCHCASVSPPGGLTPAQTPQFVTFTSDDAIQSYTMEVLDYFFAKRKNPNGCPVKTTYFNSLVYSNFGLTTDYYVAGNEVADHTMTHAGKPNSSEILGNLKALHAYSGIPIAEIKGFRAPLLSYSPDTITQLHTAGFVYDSSMTSASPANATDTDAFWPYTLDHGVANDCISVPGMCQGALKLPGLWEIPMYGTFETENSVTPIHLMDVWLDNPDPNVIVGWLKATFLAHYEGNRQPFGLYTHPIHLAVGYPGVTDPIAMRTAILSFLDWLQTFKDVYFVTNQQLLAWMQDPKPISEMASSSAVSCSTPKVDASLKMCNGIPANEAGLVLNCVVPDSYGVQPPYYWSTCYGCPVSEPTPDNPVPTQNTSVGVRTTVSGNCSTPFWNPESATCICSDASCQVIDNTGPVVEPTSSAGAVGTASGTTNPGASPSGTKKGSATSSMLRDGSLGLGLLLGVAVLAF